jgi:protein TonB
MKGRAFWPVLGYALSVAAHVGLFAWAWSLPNRPSRAERVDVQIVETIRPKPVEPKPEPPPEPPKAAEPVKLRPARRIAMTAPPPPQATPPPPQAEPPPPETAPSAAPSTGPVHLGLSLSSTAVGGAFSAPVGNSLGGGGKLPSHAAASADSDIGPVAGAAEVTSLPEAINPEIPKNEYPQAALDAGFEGAVTLKILVDATGRVRHATILKDPGYGLGAAAVKVATRYFRFKPAQRNGHPTAIEIPYTIYFELP